MPLSSRLTRRGFLALLGSGAAVALAACAGVLSPSPSSSASAVPTSSRAPSPTPAPTEQPTPRPSLRARIGQMLLVGFRGTTPAEAAATVADIRERSLGGVVLFSTDQPTGSAVRNIVSATQLSALTAALQAATADAEAGLPLIVSVDEEGGRVARLGPDHGFPATESAADLGAHGDVAYTRRAGAAIGQTLRSVGINLDLAPVVDVNVNPDNPIIGALGRSFSADADVVVAQAEAFVAGCHEAGVLTTLKHFPGHGSSTGDTHLGVVDVTDTWQRDVELAPFARLIADGVADAILTAHVFNRTLDADHPATLSAPTIDGLLREQLGWDGLVISDDMQMGAIREAYGYEEAIQLAIAAGVDVLTIAQQQVFEEGIVGRTIDLIEAMVADGRLSEERIDRSWERIRDFKARLAATAS